MLIHRDGRSSHWFLARGDNRGTTLGALLIAADFASQVRSGFSQVVRPFGDAPDHWQPGLRPGQSLPRGRLTCIVLLVEAAMPFSQLPGRLADSFDAMRPVDQPRRHPITIDVLALIRSGILERIDLLGFGDHRRSLLGEPCPAPVGVDGCVRGNPSAVDRDRAEVRQPGATGDHQNLGEQAGEPVLALRAEPRDRRMVRNVLRAQDTKRDVRATQPLELTRRAHSMAVAIDQQAQQHSRVITGSTDPAPTSASLKLADVQDIDGVKDEPDEVILRQPLSHVRWQQKGLITQHRTESLRHK